MYRNYRKQQLWHLLAIIIQTVQYDKYVLITEMIKVKELKLMMRERNDDGSRILAIATFKEFFHAGVVCNIMNRLSRVCCQIDISSGR